MKILVLVAAVVGLVLGAILTTLFQDSAQPQPVAAPSIAIEQDTPQVDASLNDELIQLRADNELLQSELSETKLELESVLARQEPVPAQAQLTDSSEDIMEQLGEEIEDAALKDMVARREEWNERRTQWREEFRTRSTAFFEDSIANASTPEEQARIQSMQEYMTAMQDLRSQLSEAETEEEAEAIRAAMRENGDTMRSMVEEQKAYMLNQVASDFGITKPGQQRRFNEALQSTMESPFFWGSRMMGAGYGGGFGGGYGGPSGRGSGGRPSRGPGGGPGFGGR